MRDPVETLARRSRYFSRVDPELLHARDQGRAFDIHSCRGPVGACYSPVCDFQYADDLLAFISFARASYWSGLAVVAQFPDWRLQRRAVGKDHRTLDEILQLTNIPRPMPTRELPHGRGGNRFDLLIHSAAVLLDEVAGQQGNILRAFA